MSKMDFGQRPLENHVVVSRSSLRRCCRHPRVKKRGWCIHRSGGRSGVCDAGGCGGDLFCCEFWRWIFPPNLQRLPVVFHGSSVRIHHRFLLLWLFKKVKKIKKGTIIILDNNNFCPRVFFF